MSCIIKRIQDILSNYFKISMWWCKHKTSVIQAQDRQLEKVKIPYKGIDLKVNKEYEQVFRL